MSTEGKFTGKTVYVIGASHGIGEAIAGAFASAGADVLITGRTKERLDAAAERIGHPVRVFQSDARRQEDVDALFAAATTKIDHLVLAGTRGDHASLSERLALAGFAPVPGRLRFDEIGYSVGYAVDFSELSDDMAAIYEGVDVWVADCLTRQPHPTHMHLDGVLSAALELRVGQVYLVHMGNGLDYRTLAAELPDWAAPAYDGLEFGS